MNAARKPNATGRRGTRFGDSKFRRLNSPPQDQNWCWLSRELLESPAWRAMSGAAHKLVDRMLLEHILHGGGENGALPVTYADLQTYGMRKSSVRPAIAEAVALGLIEVVHPGARSAGEFKGRAGLFRLAWLPTSSGKPPGSAWRVFDNLASARDVADAARRAVEVTRTTTRAPAAATSAPRAARAYSPRL